MAGIITVIEGLKKTNKGKLRYDRENLQDIFAELQRFVCLSIKPTIHSAYKEKKEEIISASNASSCHAKESRRTNDEQNDQILNHNIANIFAKAEHELLKYEQERKDSTKKLVADKRRSWEKYEQMLHKEYEEKMEQLRRKQLDKDTKNSCMYTPEETGQNTLYIPEQEIDTKIELTQDKAAVAKESEESNRLLRRNLEEALRELNCNISSIIHTAQLYAHHGMEEIDKSVQFLRNASEIMKHVVDSSHQILPSDVDETLSYVSISKEILQSMSNLPVETEEDASGRGEMNGVFAMNANSLEKKKPEQLSVSGTSQSHKNVNVQQQLATPCFKFGSSSSLTSAICLEPSQKSPFFLPVDATAVMAYAPVNSGDTSVNSHQERQTAFSFRLSPGNPGVVSGQSTHSQRDSFVSNVSTSTAMHKPIDHVKNSTNSQRGKDTSSCFNFSLSDSVCASGDVTFPHIVSSVPAISTPAVTVHASGQNGISAQEMLNAQVDHSSEVAIHKTKEMKSKVEQMDSLSSQDANDNENILNDCVPREAIKKYLALEMFLKKWKSYFEDAISKPEWKKRELLLLRAVNTPINCMSSLSGAHFLDKIERLDKFLSGENADLGRETVSINIAPEARYFCMDLLAKKMVSQGESQVSSCPEDAFPLAAAIVYLWQKYSDLGLLFMAHLYKKCPYVVPYYIPWQEGQSEEQHYKALGYLYTDAGVEKLPHFLKRMSGFSRLYFAVLQTQPKLKKPHPHGIGYGWKWMAHIMNLEPRPDITATVLLDFLEVCGHAMQKHYGKQFKRLLLTLVSEFLPKIKTISSGSMGPVVKLEEFLKTTMKKGFISPPEGVITDAFWGSS